MKGRLWKEWPGEDTQFDAVLSATPLALSLVGKISEGKVHAMGPHETPYDKVKKSAVSLEITEENFSGDMAAQGSRKEGHEGVSWYEGDRDNEFSWKRSSRSEVLDLGKVVTD